jgi:hypothetical protein
MTVRFLDLLTGEGVGVADVEFISEFFEMACQTGDMLRSEINGRGFYDCMQLLGRYIYKGREIL